MTVLSLVIENHLADLECLHGAELSVPISVIVRSMCLR